MKKSKNPLNLGLSRKGKKFITSNPRLLTISDNERQLLLNERVANILENAHKFEDHYYGYSEEEKVDFSDIPKRLARFRDLDCSLWKKAASPFEPEEETKFLRDLNASNQLKQCVTRLPTIRPANTKSKDEDAKSACPASQISLKESQNHEDSQELFESSEPEDNGGKETGEESQSQSEKKLFPIFNLSQKKKSERDSVGGDVANCSRVSNVSSDFETPRISRCSVIRPKKLSSQMPPNDDECKIIPKTSAVASSTSSSDQKGWKPPPLSMSNHKDLAQDLLSLFLEKIDADVTVYGREEKPIRAHKLILKVRCPRLLKEIVIEKSSKSKKEVIPLTCFSHTAVKSLMSYVYCGRILPPGFKISDLPERDLEEIKELGEKFGLDLSPPSQTDPGPSKRKSEVMVADTQTSFSHSEKITREAVAQTSVNTEEKAVQTDTTEELEFAQEEERLNSLREDERSRDYHHDSHLYEGVYRQVYQKSPDLFEEESFNDRVFAHSFERSTAQKRRRSWSENRRLSISDTEDNDSIILLDDDDPKSPRIEVTEHVDQKPELILEKNDSKGEQSQEAEMEDAAQPEVLDDLPQSPWGHTYDDAFFANLPADEELLNVPPTSPIGTKTYNSSPAPLPTPPAYHSPVSRKSPAKKPPAKRRPRATKAPGEKRLKTGKGRGRPAPSQESDADLDSDSECANGNAGAGYKSPRVSASQGASNANNQNNPPVDPNQTPMLNYSLIDTPILKKELKRYGLKPLPRSKAKVLLRHIYKETHK